MFNTLSQKTLAVLPLWRPLNLRVRLAAVYAIAMLAKRWAFATKEALSLIARCEPRLFAGQILVPIGLGLAPLWVSYAVGKVLATASGDGATGSLLMLCAAVAVASLFPMLAQMLDRETSDWVFDHVKSSLVKHIATLDPGRYSDPALKNLFQRTCHRVTWKFMEFFRSQVPLLKSAIAAIAAGIVVAQWNWGLVLILVVAALPAMAVEASYTQMHFRLDERQATGWRRFWEDFWFSTYAPSLAFLQALGAARTYSRAFAGRISELMRQYRALHKRFVGFRSLSMLVSQGAVCFALVLLVQGLAAGQISAAQFVLYLGSLSILAASLGEFAGALGQQIGLALYVQDWSALLGVIPSFEYPANGAAVSRGNGGIPLSVSNVRFAYPHNGNGSHEVLKGISFDVPAGQKWALVGYNGAGKSTLESVLVGLYRPQVGQVCLAGVPLEELDEQTVRSLIAFLPQQIERYNMTVKEYIALGVPGKSIDPVRVRAAALKSGAAEFIERWPKQYDQLLGRDYEGSEEPSGGQLQKLALAMMFYKDSPVLILDEPTAAIDPESSKEFWDLLLKASPGHTVLFSTHYFGAVKRADRILLLDDGQVVAQGTHAELMAGCERYRRIFESQAQDFRE